MRIRNVEQISMAISGRLGRDAGIAGITVSSFPNSKGKTKKGENSPRELTAGDIAGIPNLVWGGQGRTLILFLNTNCRFCVESMPFYRQTVELAHGKDIRFVAVFPQDPHEAVMFS